MARRRNDGANPGLKKMLILGCGNIGSVAAQDMTENMGSIEIVVADRNAATARELTEKIGTSNVSWLQLDAADRKQLAGALKGTDLAVGLLPGDFGHGLIKTCIDAGKDLVDLSYMPENPLTLNDKAAKAGVTIVPDCGLSPGIGNVLVGHAAGKLDETRAVHLMVGGFPERPAGPLGYTVTWSPENLIDEYTRKVRIVQEGRTVEVEVLSGLEEVDFPELGRLEAFYTDGLRTLLDTITDVSGMWEKTLRYPGHAEKIELLKALGFFDEKHVDVEGVSVSPRKMTAKLLEQKLSKPEVKDVVALKVEVSGIKNGEQKTYIYHMIDRYDESRGITAMARTTAYPGSIVAQMILKGALKQKGIVAPERIGMDAHLFELFVSELKKRGITITEEEIAG